jgi:hypothetical protein
VASRLTEELRKITREQSRLRPVGQTDEERDAPRGSSRLGWFAAAALVVLLVGGWLVLRQLQADAKLQDCVMSGRRNCAPVEAP